MKREQDLKGLADVEARTQSGCREGTTMDSAITHLLRRSEDEERNEFLINRLL